MQKQFKKILAIETSCDDTSVAIVGHDGFVFSLSSISQDSEHEIFGGIVPEIASRSHNQALMPLITIALNKANLSWDDIDGLCVTSEPGLLGSLIVGVVTTKSLAMTYNKDFIGVNHLEGHIVAPYLRDKDYEPKFDIEEPCIVMAVSGGHTSIYKLEGFSKYHVLGSTKDDAAGEAFDKFAKMLGLGYPGGVHIDRLSQEGDVKKYSFPRILLDKESLDFSFSGLKTAGLRMVEELSEEEIDKNINDLCASYQEAIVDTLLIKLERALKREKMTKFTITGGVIANSRLRQKAKDLAEKNNFQYMYPPNRYCTDNAAMIGLAGILRLNKGERSDLGLKPSANNQVLFRV